MPSVIYASRQAVEDDFYDRVSKASGVNREDVKKVLIAAQFVGKPLGELK